MAIADECEHRGGCGKSIRMRKNKTKLKRNLKHIQRTVITIPQTQIKIYKINKMKFKILYNMVINPFIVN